MSPCVAPFRPRPPVHDDVAAVARRRVLPPRRRRFTPGREPAPAAAELQRPDLIGPRRRREIRELAADDEEVVVELREGVAPARARRVGEGEARPAGVRRREGVHRHAEIWQALGIALHSQRGIHATHPTDRRARWRCPFSAIAAATAPPRSVQHHEPLTLQSAHRFIQPCGPLAASNARTKHSTATLADGFRRRSDCRTDGRALRSIRSILAPIRPARST